MQKNLMVLPAQNSKSIRVVRIPDDYEEHEVFRHVTGIIAQVEHSTPDYDWEDIAAALEDRGFEVVDFVLGPSLDK